MNIWQWILTVILSFGALYGLMCLLMMAEDCIEKLNRAKHRNSNREWDNFYRREERMHQD